MRSAVLPETPLAVAMPTSSGPSSRIWDLSLEGMPLCGAQKPLDTRGLKASLPKPPTAVPPCSWMHGEDSGCISRHWECLGPGTCRSSAPKHEQPPNPIARLLPSTPACERWCIYLSVQHPSAHPCPCLWLPAPHVPLSQGPLSWQALELPMPRWPDSAPLVLQMCRVCLAQCFPRSPKSSLLSPAGQLLFL